jgi:hypothetical protein
MIRNLGLCPEQCKTLTGGRREEREGGRKGRKEKKK